jgi:hypothetical protein
MRLFDKQVPSNLRLDLTLASQMRPHPVLSARLRELGLSRRELKVAIKRAAEAGVIGQIRIPWMVVLEYFGEPEARGLDHLTYRLTLWPEHHFRFGIHPQGWVSHDGFQLITPATRHVPTPTVLSDARRVLQPGHDTVLEVREILDAPKLVQGWERMEDWYYIIGTDSRDLV